MEKTTGKSGAVKFCSSCRAAGTMRSDHNARTHDAVLAKESARGSASSQSPGQQQPVKVTDVSVDKAAKLLAEDMLLGTQQVVIPPPISQLLDRLQKLLRTYETEYPPTPRTQSPVADLTSRFGGLSAATSLATTPTSGGTPSFPPSSASPSTPNPATPTKSSTGEPQTPVSRLYRAVKESNSTSINACLKDVLQQVLALFKPEGPVGHSSMTPEILQQKAGEQLYDLVQRVGNALRPLKQIVGMKRGLHGDEAVEEEQVQAVRLSLQKLAEEGVIVPLELQLSDEAAEYVLQDRLLEHFLAVEMLSYFKLKSEKELYPVLGAILLELLRMDFRRERLVGAMSAMEAVGGNGEEDDRAAQEEESDATAQRSDELPLQQGTVGLDLEHQVGPVPIEPLRGEGHEARLQQAADDGDEEADCAATDAVDKELVETVVNLLLWHEGYVSSDVSKGNIEFTTVESRKDKVEGSMEVKVNREKIAESLPQATSELLAIMLSNQKDGKYEEGEAPSAWNILTCLELWLGMRATLLDATPGNMKVQLEVAGPFRLYDLRTRELHPEAEQVVKMVVQLALPNMSSADKKLWADTRVWFKDSLEMHRARKLQKRNERVEQDAIRKRAKLAEEEASREKAARIAAEEAKAKAEEEALTANRRVEKLAAFLKEKGLEVPEDL